MKHEMWPGIIAGKIHNLVFKENDMRRNLIAVFMAGLAIFILSGCGGDDTSTSTSTGNTDLDKALDDMKFENAPTLGPVAKKYFAAMYTGKWETVWDMQSSETQNTIKEGWEAAKTLPSGEEKQMADKAGSAKEYYVLLMKKDEKPVEESVKEITKEETKFEVAGERFSEDGKTGYIEVKYLQTGEEDKEMFTLVKEGDDWKVE